MWIAWTFVPYLTWAGWIHAAIRSKHSGYYKFACLYGAPFLLMLLFGDKGDTERQAGEPFIGLNVIAWIASIIHACVAKKEVDLRIKYADLAAGKGDPSKPEELEARIAAEYGVAPRPDPIPEQPARREEPQVAPAARNPEPREFPTAAAPKAPPPASPSAPPLPAAGRTEPAESARIDVNHAAESELATLPGVGPILAKKAVAVRNSEGGFDSLEQFSAALSLKPHVVDRLRPFIVVGPRPAPVPPTPGVSSARRVDF